MISNRCLYALKAILELSLRRQQGPVTIGEIAGSQQIPARFLEAILRQLKQAGIVNSVRGKEGGYHLAREPHTISVGEIIRQFEGPLVMTGKSDAGDRSEAIPDVFATVWQSAEAALAEVYDGTDFGSLAEWEQNRSQIQATNFTI